MAMGTGAHTILTILRTGIIVTQHRTPAMPVPLRLPP